MVKIGASKKHVNEREKRKFNENRGGGKFIHLSIGGYYHGHKLVKNIGGLPKYWGSITDEIIDVSQFLEDMCQGCPTKSMPMVTVKISSTYFR